MLTKDIEKMITKNHTGKMTGMLSLSTSCTCNERCKRNAQIEGSICSHCYASKMMKRYKTLEIKLADNYKVLTSQVIPVKDFPLLNVRYFRFESFGDVANEIQVFNYCNFARRNPKTTFAVWTKQPDIYKKAFDTLTTKPKNLIIIYSTMFINAETVDPWFTKRYPFVDKAFLVYTKEFAEFNDIKITCGGRKCLECGRCYSRKTGFYVTELLK